MGIDVFRQIAFANGIQTFVDRVLRLSSGLPGSGDSTERALFPENTGSQGRHQNGRGHLGFPLLRHF
jgi:hypothetical protein